MHYYSIDLLGYLPIEVSATYDSKTFTSMVYALVQSEWCKKESVKDRFDLHSISNSFAKPKSIVLKEIEEVKGHLHGIKETLVSLQEPVS